MSAFIKDLSHVLDFGQNEQANMITVWLWAQAATVQSWQADHDYVLTGYDMVQPAAGGSLALSFDGQNVSNFTPGGANLTIIGNVLGITQGTNKVFKENLTIPVPNGAKVRLFNGAASVAGCLLFLKS